MTQASTHEIEELRLLMGSPRDPHGRVFAQLGDALRRAGSHREALALLLDGVAEHPNFSPGHLVLAWTAQEAGDLEIARAAYERTVTLDPENPNGLFGLGALLDRAGDPRGEGMMREAEALDRRVRMLAPRLPVDGPVSGDPGPPTPLEDLPFVSLRDLAPDDVEAGLEGLPFVPLEDLAPDGEAPLGDAELAALPFVPLADLAPDPSDASEAAREELGALPFVPVDDLAPGPDGTTDVGDGEQELDDPGSVVDDPGEIEDDVYEPVMTGVDPVLQEGDTAEPPEDDLDDEDDSLGGHLVTRTMGELLVRQGLMTEAVEVFEQLMEEEPHDEALRLRLDELRSAMNEPMVPRTRQGAGPSEAEAEAAHPSVDPPQHHPLVPSPFHLEEDDRDDDGGEGPPVGDYFARLLAWTSRRPAEDEGDPPSDP